MLLLRSWLEIARFVSFSAFNECLPFGMNVVVGEVVATYNPNKDIITFYSQLRNGFSHFEQLSKLGRLAEFAREYD